MPEARQVSLRSIALGDAPEITALLEGDTDLALQTATIPIPYTIEHALHFLALADSHLIFAITVDGQFVGMVGISDGDEVELGYWIGRPHWQKGYATTAVDLLCAEARQRGIISLRAEVFPDNSASMRVLEKNGFRRVGEVQRDLPQRGGLRSLIRFVRSL